MFLFLFQILFAIIETLNEHVFLLIVLFLERIHNPLAIPINRGIHLEPNGEGNSANRWSALECEVLN